MFLQESICHLFFFVFEVLYSLYHHLFLCIVVYACYMLLCHSLFSGKEIILRFRTCYTGNHLVPNQTVSVVVFAMQCFFEKRKRPTFLLSLNFLTSVFNINIKLGIEKKSVHLWTFLECEFVRRKNVTRYIYITRLQVWILYQKKETISIEIMN